MDPIDLRETIIPFSLLEIINQFKKMRRGDTMEILGIERDIIPDLKRILPAGAYRLSNADIMNADSLYFRLWITKTQDQQKENCHVNSRSKQH